MTYQVLIIFFKNVDFFFYILILLRIKHITYFFKLGKKNMHYNTLCFILRKKINGKCILDALKTLHYRTNISPAFTPLISWFRQSFKSVNQNTSFADCNGKKPTACDVICSCPVRVFIFLVCVYAYVRWRHGETQLPWWGSLKKKSEIQIAWRAGMLIIIWL